MQWGITGGVSQGTPLPKGAIKKKIIINRDSVNRRCISTEPALRAAAQLAARGPLGSRLPQAPLFLVGREVVKLGMEEGLTDNKIKITVIK